MKNADALPKRKPLRLNGYDYSSCGAYFITLCVKDKRRIFWESVGANRVRPDIVPLSRIGEIVSREIQKISVIYDNVEVDKFVVMPNHVHMILSILADDHGRTQFAPTVSRVVKQFKGSVTKQIGFSPWQRSYHDHVIRNVRDYGEIWQYIDENPFRWESDCYY